MNGTHVKQTKLANSSSSSSFFFFLEESDFSSLLYLIAVEYYIYERPSDYVDNRLKNMEIFDSTILRFSIFKIGREYILFLVQYVSTIL